MMTEEEIQMLRDEGIETIGDLAEAEKPTIMKLRGGSADPDPLDGPEQYRALSASYAPFVSVLRQSYRNVALHLLVLTVKTPLRYMCWGI